MDKCDVLIHVAAPATIRDDQKYRWIAQSVSAFQPISVMRLDSEEDAISVSHKRNDWPAELVDSAGCTAVAHSAHDSGENVQEYNAERPILLASDRDSQVPTAPRFDTGLGPSLARDWTASSALQYDSRLVASTGIFDTPSNYDRPRTAPETITPRLQVPASTTRKRAHSLSPTSTYSYTTVSNSQRTPLRVSQSLSESNMGISNFMRDDRAVAGRHQSNIQGSPVRAIKRARTAASDEGNELLLGNEDHNSSGISHQAYNRRPTHMDGLLVGSRLNLSPSPQASLSTVSPSQPVSRTFYGATAMVNQPPNSVATEQVQLDLRESSMTPARSSTSLHGSSDSLLRNENMHEPTNRVCEPITGANTGVAPAEQSGCKLSFSSVVASAAPPVTSNRFTTHISSTLSAIEARLPLVKHFRPCYARRDVKFLERGYWKLVVDIAPLTTVALTRGSPNKADLLQHRRVQLRCSSVWDSIRDYGQQKRTPEPSNNCPAADSQQAAGFWTQSEFDTFWKNLTRFVRDEKAGWGVRAIKDIMPNPQSAPRENLRVMVKVYSWGEIVGHLWLALWVLSDKLVAYIPMAWIAADETVVVRMTGDRRRHGRLGAWIRKGPDGEHGRWGVS